jgi:hypothetical protein
MTDSKIKTYKTDEFSTMSWHDNYLHGISWKQEFESGTNDFILDIDYIVEWVCTREKEFRFKISPCDLIFHNITDLKININCGDSNFQAYIEGGIPIFKITREQIKNQKTHLDKPYYQWKIELDNLCKNSYISFGSTGFTQTLRKEPILVDKQWLASAQRY